MFSIVSVSGDLHWKIVSVYIHRSGQVMLKMKSKHVGSTITKKKKSKIMKSVSGTLIIYTKISH